MRKTPIVREYMVHMSHEYIRKSSKVKIWGRILKADFSLWVLDSTQKSKSILQQNECPGIQSVSTQKVHTDSMWP